MSYNIVLAVMQRTNPKISVVKFDERPFAQRLLLISLLPFGLIIMLMLLMLQSAESKYATSLALVLFLGTMLFNSYRCRYYITEISKINYNEIVVSYLDFSKKKKFVAEMHALKLNRGILWSKYNKMHFLELESKKDNFHVKQYSMGDWKKSTMDDVLKNWN